MDKVRCIDIGFAGTLGRVAGVRGSTIALADCEISQQTVQQTAYPFASSILCEDAQ